MGPVNKGFLSPLVTIVVPGAERKKFHVSTDHHRRQRRSRRQRRRRHRRRRRQRR